MKDHEDFGAAMIERSKRAMRNEDDQRGPQGLAALDVSVSPDDTFVPPGVVRLGYDAGRYHDGGDVDLSPNEAIELAIRLLEAARKARHA